MDSLNRVVCSMFVDNGRDDYLAYYVSSEGLIHRTW